MLRSYRFVGQGATTTFDRQVTMWQARISLRTQALLSSILTAAGNGGELSSSLTLVAPILFRLAPHRWRRRILDRQPMIDPTGSIRRTELFRHDALAAELAGVLEHDRAVAVGLW